MATVVLVAAGTASCGSQQVLSMPGGASGDPTTSSSSDARPPAALPHATAPSLGVGAADPRAGLAVPAWYRIEITGTVHENGGVVDINLPGWLLVTYPIDQFGASGNDINIVDIGIATDRTPIEGIAGALWFGTNTLVAQAMGFAIGLDDNSADVVSQWREDDVVYAALVPGVARWQFFNIYNVATGVSAQISNALEGTVSVRFAPDGESITGRIDLAGTSGFNGPTNSTAYHAAITGVRHVES